jgi:hypothetical protein
MSVKNCSKCSISFECTNEKMGCWCEEMFLSIDTLTELKQTYSDCLCPKCLKEFEKVNYPGEK